MEFLYLIIGLLIGAVVAYFISRSKGAASAALLEAERKARSDEKEQSAAQVNALKQEHANTLAGLKAECEERINAAKAENEKRIEAAKAENETRLEATKCEAEAQAARIKEEATKSLTEAKREHQEKMQDAVADFEKRVAVVRTELEKRLEEVKAEGKKQLEDERTAHRADKELFEQQIKTTKQEDAELLATTKREYEQIIVSTREEAGKALQQAKREAEEQRARELGELQKRYDALLQQFKAEVTTATEKLLKERSGELQQANTQKMDELFRPIKDDITSLQKLMNEDRVTTAQRDTHFEDIMRQMMDSNAKIGSQADRLSTALLRKNKVAGNWGELILTELLESQGLTPGTHFDVQQTIRDDSGRTVYNEETGSRMIPDIILHLGDDREVVVDSKMSLTAFVDYQNAEDEVARQTALQQHLDSVRAHVRELSTKDYSSYIAKPRKSIGFVIMFVPIEGALQLALSAEPTLWREAFDKKVFIASGQTLTAALHIISLTWINIQQERNTQKILKEAQLLVDRVAGFYKEFITVGSKLNDASKAYEVVEKRVNSGKQSILALGNRLEDLGVHGKKSLPRPDSTEDYIESFEELTDN